MTTISHRFGAPLRAALRACAGIACALLLGAAPAWAQENAIQSIVANQIGGNVIVLIGFKNPVGKPPLGFSTASPARIALDFPGVENATGRSTQEINLGDVRSVAIAQAGGRSRLVFSLVRGLNYATAVDQNTVVVTIASAGNSATPLGAGGQPVQAAASAPATPAARGGDMLKDIEFRQGNAGEGRIVVELPGKQTAVDVRQQGQTVVVDFIKTGVPEALRRKLDVSQFSTPVASVTTQPRGDGARMTIEPRGSLWEHSAYQTDNQLVIEIKPIKEDPNRLGAGVRAYRGDKITLNFQNIEVRQILEVLAEHSGLNIIASDSVGGSLTLRLKDVPWDQALDIVMQAKGLDMRRNGNVMMIAPRDELLTKEKLDLEQRAQIAELEPLRAEVFQLNYQKAENFKTVFGLDTAAGGSNRSILSKRGSATFDPRTNKLFISDIASKLDEVRKLIQLTDVPSRQVAIEARVVEANDTFSRTLGAKLGFADLRTIRGGDTGYSLGSGTTARGAVTGTLQGLGEQTGQAAITPQSYIPNTQFVNLPAQGLGGTTPGSLAVSLFSAAANRFLNLELSALEADGKGKIVSSPRVIATDQQRAVMEDGEEIPFQRATSSGATSVEFRKASLRLEVTPQITPDGNVILEVDISKDSRGNPTPGGFAINTKHVSTNVQVENGGTVVLGGVYTQTELNGESKVPLLGDIPVLGRLFKSTLRTNDKTELLIFITPKIVAEQQVQLR